MPHAVRLLVAAVLLTALCVRSLHAQNATGVINGSVTDPNSAAVVNATVTATSKDT